MDTEREHIYLISVIIPTFNYARFLPKTLASVFNQTYSNYEIIVIDDGSTDNTKSIIADYPSVRYFYQRNKGLSSARNAGIDRSKGDFLVFLDADDWLERDGLEKNVAVLKNEPNVAFISGNYYLLREGKDRAEPVAVDVTTQHYLRLLESNYIGMHAAVMFQRWVFDKIRYDPALKACEDYDLYLMIARVYPVLHHQHFIATYNFHSAGMSHNIGMMIAALKAVFQKQAAFIHTTEEIAAYLNGLEQWRAYQTLLKEPT